MSTVYLQGNVRVLIYTHYGCSISATIAVIRGTEYRYYSLVVEVSITLLFNDHDIDGGLMEVDVIILNQNIRYQYEYYFGLQLMGPRNQF